VWRATLDSEKSKAVLISQFLTRVAEGRHLDVEFEADDKLTPLEAAAAVLDQIIEEEDDLRILQEEIKTLVKIQYLRMKMSMVVGKKDPYHEFLENFSYSKMLKKITSYTSLVLARRPPVFLLQAATKMVEAKGKLDVQAGENNVCDEPVTVSENKDQKAHNSNDKDFQKEDLSTSESEDTSLEKSSADLNPNEITEEAVRFTDKATERPQRRLFSLEQGTPWHPDKSRKVVSKSILGKKHHNLENVPSENLETSINPASNKRRQPWTWEEDELLKKGVKKYGAGNWSKILVHYKFNNRTGVMLKDRWRTMRKLNMVNDE
ncbi:hypothetical protein GDO81_011355, partial [Engystomops pustulosus]